MRNRIVKLLALLDQIEILEGAVVEADFRQDATAKEAAENSLMISLAKLREYDPAGVQAN